MINDWYTGDGTRTRSFLSGKSVLETVASTSFATPVYQSPGSSKCRSPVSLVKSIGGPRILTYGIGFLPFFLGVNCSLTLMCSMGTSA